MLGAGDENPGVGVKDGVSVPNVEEAPPKVEPKPGVLPVPNGEEEDIPIPKAGELC